MQKETYGLLEFEIEPLGPLTIRFADEGKKWWWEDGQNEQTQKGWHHLFLDLLANNVLPDSDWQLLTPEDAGWMTSDFVIMLAREVEWDEWGQCTHTGAIYRYPCDAINSELQIIVRDGEVKLTPNPSVEYRTLTKGTMFISGMQFKINREAARRIMEIAEDVPNPLICEILDGAKSASGYAVFIEGEENEYVLRTIRPGTYRLTEGDYKHIRRLAEEVTSEAESK